MRPTIVAGNWKMHLDTESARALATEIRNALQIQPPGAKAGVVLCPPFPLLPVVREVLSGTGIGLGAQNLYPADSGAYTGEVSPVMLRAAGCTHVILGHSERRQYFQETDAFIGKKLRKALEHALLPIVCVGETLEQRESGSTQEIIGEQLRGVLSTTDAEEMRGVMLAYEPVWAIGTGRTATPEQAQEVHAFIRAMLADMFGDAVAADVVVQYGGSVKADNALELFRQPDVDGGLIGGASLAAEQFLAIIRAADAARA